MQTTTTYIVAYARVSTPKQAAEGESLELQATHLRSGAERLGWRLFPDNHVFHEQFTGGTDERPVYNEILTLIRRNPGKIRYFVVKYIDRFSREGSLKYQQMKAELAALGVEVRDLSGIIQPSVNSLHEFGFAYPWSQSSPSQISELVMAETARYEKSMILTRMVGAQIKLTQDGYHIGRPDDGYVGERIFVGSKRKYVLVPDPDRAHFFAEMFRLRAEGAHSDAEIVAQLNRLGFRTKTTKRWDAQHVDVIGHRHGVPLTVKQLQAIIHRPVYCGIVCEKWTNNAPIRAQGGQPVVPIAVFNKANRGKVFVDERPDNSIAILYDHHPDKAIQKRHAFNPAFPYKNVVRCPECDKPLMASCSRGRSGQRFGAYHCTRLHRRYAVAQTALEPVFDAYLSHLRCSETFLDWFQLTLMRGFRDAEGVCAKRTAEANRYVAELEDKHVSLIDAFASATTQGMRAELERRAATLQEEIDAARSARGFLELTENDLYSFVHHARLLMEHPAQILRHVHNLREQLALYSLFFAQAPTYEEILNGTPKLALCFTLSERQKTAESDLMNLPGLRWNTIVDEIRRWQMAYWVLDIVTERLNRDKDDKELVHKIA